jgi:parallel beta-helix repeat protein
MVQAPVHACCGAVVGMVALSDLLTLFNLYSAGRQRTMSSTLLRRVFGDHVLPRAVGDGVADDTAAFAAAIASGKPVMVPEATYKLTAPLTLPAGTKMIGIGKPTFVFVGAMATGCIQFSGGGCILRDLKIDAQKSSKAGNNACAGIQLSTNDNEIERCEVVNAQNPGIKITGDRNKVRLCKVNGSSQPNIQILGPTVLAAPGTVGGSYNTVEQCELSGSLVFGMMLDDAAHDNLLLGNRCTQSGLELIGITYSCYRNQVIGNHAEGTGDNGISCTGYENVISGNLCVGNANSGIHIYGSFNSVSGNTCLNNNKSASTFAGIDLGASWGGLGSYNSVTGNTCYDDQAVPTQQYGINQGAGFYPAWVAGGSLAYPYVSSGLNIYKRVAGATTIPASGAVAPSHPSGDVNDGTVTWRFVAAADTNLNGKRNGIAANTCRGNAIKSYNDATGNAHTVLHEGIVTLDASVLGGSTNPALPVQVLSGNVTPGGNIIGNPGDIYLRRGGSPGITVYMKTAGASDSTNWFAFQERRSGNTASRPALSGSGFDGFMYWDSTLQKPVWFSSAITGYKDATGATV